jgi:hypothetical protein
VKPVFGGRIGEEVAFGVRTWARELEGDTWATSAIVSFMGAAGVGYSLARRVAQFFGGPAVADIIARRDPYRLLDVPGVGWTRADAIARHLGVSADADERLEAAVQTAMERRLERGHTGATIAEVLDGAVAVAGGQRAGLRAALMRSLTFCELVRSRDLVFLPAALEAEWTIASFVDGLLVHSKPPRAATSGS